jgi:hypothetical protein
MHAHPDRREHTTTQVGSLQRQAQPSRPNLRTWLRRLFRAADARDVQWWDTPYAGIPDAPRFSRKGSRKKGA